MIFQVPGIEGWKGSGTDAANRIEIDSQGNAYVVGTTSSADFPVTADAYQRTRRGPSDAFILKISPNGDRIVYATLFGGSGEETAPTMLLDAATNIAIGGTTGSSDLPVSADAPINAVDLAVA